MSLEGNPIESKLAEHQGKWFWIRNNYAHMDALPMEFFAERVQELARMPRSELSDMVSRISGSPRTNSEKKAGLFAEHRPDDKLRQFVHMNEVFAEMQDARKGYVLKANYYHRLFLQKASGEFSKPIEDLWFYSYEELIESISSGAFLPQEEVERRRKLVVAVEGRSEKSILSGDEALLFYNGLQEEIKHTDTIKGLIAQTGTVTGKVKVVLKMEDMRKVRDGDILVTSMTRPEMTPAMKIAGAFVTDEGGITSHAAIVAREMKKPCIIGTKIATKVLKDGDTVIVDADKGIVKIVKS
ncbi:MAG: hypothetical protein KGH98_05160 [Candidatus Micrarchaeota archaeon]|nr:hypothetical protein [Candidatus Micrarchaeota archaeon]